jgi:hypothetical protein
MADTLQSTNFYEYMRQKISQSAPELLDMEHPSSPFDFPDIGVGVRALLEAQRRQEEKRRREESEYVRRRGALAKITQEKRRRRRLLESTAVFNMDNVIVAYSGKKLDSSATRETIVKNAFLRSGARRMLVIARRSCKKVILISRQILSPAIAEALGFARDCDKIIYCPYTYLSTAIALAGHMEVGKTLLFDSNADEFSELSRYGGIGVRVIDLENTWREFCESL